MKKWLFKLALVAMTFLLLPIQAVQACCGFIIGRQLTKDGTTHQWINDLPEKSIYN